MPKIAIWIIAVSLALMAIASFWLAGEMHYRKLLGAERTKRKAWGGLRRGL
jgi:hypothetical protein